MEKKFIPNKIAQIGFVVRDLDAAMKTQWEEYGIGPWTIYTFDPSNVTDMVVRDERVDHAMRLAFTFIDDVMWELIQPLDDKTIYAEPPRGTWRGKAPHSVQRRRLRRHCGRVQGKGNRRAPGGQLPRSALRLLRHL